MELFFILLGKRKSYTTIGLSIGIGSNPSVDRGGARKYDPPSQNCNDNRADYKWADAQLHKLSLSNARASHLTAPADGLGLVGFRGRLGRRNRTPGGTVCYRFCLRCRERKQKKAKPLGMRETCGMDRAAP